MAKKSVKKAQPVVTAPDALVPEQQSDRAMDPLPTVKVNNANVAEIKSALDDIVKKYLMAQSFTPSLLHPTVHLGLGYSSVILALSSVLYSLKVSFEDSKPVLWVAVTGYFILQAILWAWKRWIEKGEVFKGKRRRMIKRIETDHVQIISSTILTSPPLPVLSFSPHTRPSSPNSNPASPNPSSPLLSSPSSTSPSKPSILSVPSTSPGPTYIINLSLSTTSNKGKSLIHKSRIIVGRGVAEFVDEEGGVEEEEFKRWLGLILSEAGLVGAEESEETKEE